MTEEQLLNRLGQKLLSETKRTFYDSYPSRGFSGLNKPIRGQFPTPESPKIASRKYVDSLQYRINTDPEDNQPYIEIYSTLEGENNYGVYIQDGRSETIFGDGRFAKGFPNIEKIRQWIAQKGIQSKSLPSENPITGKITNRIPTLTQLTYLISRGIARDGIFPFPFRDITLSRIQRNLAQEFEPALAEHVNRLIRERVVFIINPGRQTR